MSNPILIVKLKENLKIVSGKIFIDALKNLYTCKAYVTKIIDGDTIWMNIDLGFKTWIIHKIRLRGIAILEISTK